MPPTNPLASPALSSASSSFDMISNLSSVVSLRTQQLHSASDDGSDDEIVYSPDCSSSDSEFSSDSASDDYVVLSDHRPSPSLSSADEVASQLSSLSLSGSSGYSKPAPSKRSGSSSSPRDRGHARVTNPAVKSVSSSSKLHKSGSVATLKKPTATSAQPTPPSPSKSARRRQKQRQQQQALARGGIQTGLGQRPIVDDVSELSSVQGDDRAYEEAVAYITSFLSSPLKDSVAYLTFLQSLIVELGIATTSLPRSLTAAKALIKSQAFLNICEYLEVRSQGQGALQRVMYPSRSALIKSIRQTRNRAPLKMVKSSGLQVLLVSCYH
ncbi:hypothetical protein BDN72DRAFT_895049 [Pluteus cervinus]|uniref:Uncharacterized protein n=1 Tax=Pluteus cervinus TaxID=181527 RepID=A0ACD3B366_9AGAR|nr:hypothetical protein BDN72DRAFT_895049 [Pluteus cervinus]